MQLGDKRLIVQRASIGARADMPGRIGSNIVWVRSPPLFLSWFSRWNQPPPRCRYFHPTLHYGSGLHWWCRPSFFRPHPLQHGMLKLFSLENWLPRLPLRISRMTKNTKTSALMSRKSAKLTALSNPFRSPGRSPNLPSDYSHNTGQHPVSMFPASAKSLSSSLTLKVCVALSYFFNWLNRSCQGPEGACRAQIRWSHCCHTVLPRGCLRKERTYVNLFLYTLLLFQWC